MALSDVATRSGNMSMRAVRTVVVCKESTIATASAWMDLFLWMRVQRLGGTFELDSTPGEGTAIRISAPI